MNFFRNLEIRRQLLATLALLTLCTVSGSLWLPSFFQKRLLEMGAETMGGISRDMYLISGILLAGTGLIQLFSWLLFTFRRYQRLGKLAEDTDRILHGERELKLEQYQEGELSVLANEIQKMLSKLVEQSKRLEREKVNLSNSMADISHQLRTPLTSLQLLMIRLSGEQEETERSRLTGEGAMLLNRVDWLVNGLLKIARIDAGMAVFSREWVGAEKLVELALEPLWIPLELRQQEVVRDLAVEDGAEKKGKEPGFWGDLAWSGEALGNILKNCMEHTPKGGTIWIHGKENRLYTEFLVEDNGSGIAKEDLPHLFERFYKGKDAGNSSVGIGLSLARMIVKEQNGTVKVENRREGGARFIIRFYKGVI